MWNFAISPLGPLQKNRVNSLEEFGTLDFAAERLLGAEKAKDSVQEATLLGSGTHVGDSGT